MITYLTFTILEFSSLQFNRGIGAGIPTIPQAQVATQPRYIESLDRQIEIQIVRKIERQKERQRERNIDRKIDRKIDKKIYRKIDRKKDR